MDESTFSQNESVITSYARTPGKKNECWQYSPGTAVIDVRTAPVPGRHPRRERAPVDEGKEEEEEKKKKEEEEEESAPPPPPEP